MKGKRTAKDAKDAKAPRMWRWPARASHLLAILASLAVILSN